MSKAQKILTVVLITLGAAVIVVLAFIFIEAIKIDAERAYTVVENKNDVAAPTKKPTPNPTFEPTPEPTPSFIQYNATLISGNYTAGMDFPAGVYDIEAVSGGGNVSSDNLYDGGINAIMGTEDKNDRADLYEQQYSNIRLPEGTVLRISGVVVEISSDKASSEPLKKREQVNLETIELGSGYFVSGEDFPAGVYNIMVSDGKGNVSSDNLYDGGINAIMGISDHDMYEAEYRNIELPAGVTLKVDGLKIKLIPSY
jgi:hypothetical protein